MVSLRSVELMARSLHHLTMTARPFGRAGNAHRCDSSFLLLHRVDTTAGMADQHHAFSSGRQLTLINTSAALR